MLVAFNARDVDAFMAHVTDDFEMESRFASVGQTIWRGREGVIAWWADLADAWTWMELEFDNSADVGADRSVLLMTLRGIGQGSGMRLDEPIAQYWYWREERVARIEYLDRLEALEAVGLSE